MSYRRSDWTPAEIPNADYQTTGLNIAIAELDLQHIITENTLFPRLPTLRYEWTPENSDLQSRLNELQSAPSSQDPAAYFRMLGDLPLLGLGEIFPDSLATVDVEYERFAFASDVTTSQGRDFIPLEGDTISLNPGDSIQGFTIFEKWTLALDVIADIPNETADHNVEVGAFVLTYEKPYNVTLDGNALDSTIRESEFTAFGASFYYDGRFKLSGDGDSEDGLFAELGANIDFGIGDIEFANGSDISQFLDDAKSVHYYGLGVDAGLSWRGGGLSMNVGGNYRYHTFEQADETPGGSFSTFNVGVLDVNVDQVWFLGAGLSYSF